MNPKLYLIIIAHATQLQFGQLKAILNLKDSAQTTISLRAAQFTPGISMGWYNDNLLLVSDTLVFNIIEPEGRDVLTAFTRVFNHNEIVALTLISTVELYGYSVIRDGQIIRAKSGSPDGIYVDKGDLLPLEKRLKSKPLLTSDEMNTLKADYPDQKEIDRHIENEYGIRAVELLFAHYLNHDVIDDTLLDRIEVRQMGQ